VFLLEATGLTFLMGLFPPLRPMWLAAGAFFGIIVLYVALLFSMGRIDREIRRNRERFAAAMEAPARPPAPVPSGNGKHRGAPDRHVPIGRGRSTRPAYNGLSVVDAEEVHVVVRAAGELQPAVR
jgi:hypothetical protein